MVRTTLTQVCASEVGTIPIENSSIIQKGRLQPGKMLLIDTLKGKVVEDADLKAQICSSRPFEKWINDRMISMDDIKQWAKRSGRYVKHILDSNSVTQDARMLAFGFTLEQLTMLIQPMVNDGKEALGSMGFDTPLACLSRKVAF